MRFGKSLVCFDAENLHQNYATVLEKLLGALTLNGRIFGRPFGHTYFHSDDSACFGLPVFVLLYS